ncbi:MAG: PHP domain-containing protein [Planctomycetota bacterium]|nr:PHP domain-containing protein [Planctomycetota bacterium]
MSDARRIDLHAHTNHSDGTCTPTELVETAAEAGLTALAVTDHDVTSALDEAHAAGARLGVEIIDGCEISATLPTGTVHILAYAFDVAHEGLQALLAEVREGRDARNALILEKLEGLGMPLEEAEVRAFAHGCIVARPHFAMAMVKRGYADDIREVFRHWLHDRGPAYVQAEMPTPETAIEAVVAAGGVAVLAHGKSLRLGAKAHYRPILERFKEAGLGGVEVDHPTHDRGWRKTFREIADALDLVPTGGSDFHGAAKPHIQIGEGDGTIDVRYDTWERLAARARS